MGVWAEFKASSPQCFCSISVNHFQWRIFRPKCVLKWTVSNLKFQHFSGKHVPGPYRARLALCCVLYIYWAQLPIWKIINGSECYRTWHHIVDFPGSRWMKTAPTSIEVLLRPTLVQSDEPSDLRGSLSPTTRHRCMQHELVYTAPGSPRRSPIQLWTGRDVA